MLEPKPKEAIELEAMQLRLETQKTEIRIKALDVAMKISEADKVTSTELVTKASEILKYLQGESK